MLGSLVMSQIGLQAPLQAAATVFFDTNNFGDLSTLRTLYASLNRSCSTVLAAPATGVST